MTGRTTPEPGDPDRATDAAAELLAAAALGALPPDQEAVTLAYLEGNSAARTLLAEYRAVVGVFPYAAPLSPPPPALRDSLLRAARASRPRHRPTRRSTWHVAIAAYLLIVLLAWTIGVHQRLGALPFTAGDGAAALFATPGLEGYDMSAEPSAPGATGRIYLSPDGTRAAMVAAALPQLPAGWVYQIWFDRAATAPLGMATFEVDARGAAIVVMPLPAAGGPYVACQITREPQGGSARPSGPQMLVSERWLATDILRVAPDGMATLASGAH